MITITVVDSLGEHHSKTRPTFWWAWRALARAKPDLVPVESGNHKIHGFYITSSSIFGGECYIQLGSFFTQAGMWIWRNR